MGRIHLTPEEQDELERLYRRKVKGEGLITWAMIVGWVSIAACIASIILLCAGCTVGVSGHLGVQRPVPAPAPIAESRPAADQALCEWSRARTVELAARYGVPDTVRTVWINAPGILCSGYFDRDDPVTIYVYTRDPIGRPLERATLSYVWHHEWLHYLDDCAGKPPRLDSHMAEFEARMRAEGFIR